MHTLCRFSAMLLTALVLVHAPTASAQGSAAEPAATSNVGVVRGLYDSFARGDVPSVVQKFDADIAWTIPEGLYFGGTYRGPEAILSNVFMRLASEWDDFRAVPAEFIGNGEHVLVRGTYMAAHKGTGTRLNVPFVHVYRLQNGLVAEYQGYTDTALYNKAAGK